MEKGFSTKSKIVYGIMLCVIVFLMWLGDEGKQPIVYEGGELQHGIGVNDSNNALIIGESVARAGVIASTPKYIMNRGTYRMRLEYTAESEGSVLELWEQGSKIGGWSLNPRETEVVCEFTLSKDAKQLQAQIYYSGSKNLTISKLELTPHTLFYTDTYYMITVFLLLNLAGCLLYRRHLRKPFSEEILTDGCVLAGVSLLAMSPMFQTFLYNGDDLCYHLARMEGLKDGILDGQIVVNILPEGLQGNGYLNAMYPYLFLYIGAFLRICRVSIALSYKTIIFLSHVGSALSAYCAVKSMTCSRRSVILATVLYTLMPYRFTNIFSRGDLGETLALIFWPLVIAGLYHICLGERKKWYYLVIGFSGALQSHILSVVFVAAFCLITVLLYCVPILKEKRYVEIGKAAGLTILLNLWYLVPFLYYYFKETLGKEVLRWSGYFEQSVNLSNMTQSLSLYNKQYFTLGLALLGCLGIGVVYLFCERRDTKTPMQGFLVYLLVMGCILTCMTTGYFPNRSLLEWDFMKSALTMIQFPWRFLGPASTCFLFAGAIGLSDSRILRPYRNIVFALLVGLNLLIIVSVPMDNNHMPYYSVESVASKGHESKLGSNVGIFYPHEWRIEGASDERLTSSVIISDLNHISVHDFVKKGTKAVVTYTAGEDSGYIELPIQSYMGYRAKDENGEKVEILRGEGARMRFLVKGDGQKHTIYVRYGPVAGFVIANILSSLTIAVIGWQFFRRRIHPEKLS